MILNIPTIENFCINACFGLLLLTTIYYWSQIFFARETYPSKLGLFGSGGAVVCLTTHLLFRWFDSGHFPLSNLYESLLFLTWCLLILLICLEAVLKNLFLGVLLSPAVLCLIAFTDFSLPSELQKSSPLVPALQSNWLVMHVTVMIASYAALLFGCLVAIAYLLFSQWTNQSQATNSVSTYSFPNLLGKSKTNSVFGTNLSTFAPGMELSTTQTGEFLSSKVADSQRDFLSRESSKEKTGALLTFLDNISYRTIGIGFCFLTLGILSGAVSANETWGNYWSWDPKETWALITWFTFATYLHSRLVGGWTGSKPAWIASFGFFIIWICYLGVNLLGQGLHSYGFLQF